MSKSIDLWEVDLATRYMVDELRKEMASVVEQQFKPIHEKIDRLGRAWRMSTHNFHHPTRRTSRSLIEDAKSTDQNWDNIENTLYTYLNTQCSNRREMVAGFECNATNDEGEVDPKKLSEEKPDDEDEESSVEMPDLNFSCDDVVELSIDEGEAKVDQEKLSDEEPDDDDESNVEMPDLKVSCENVHEVSNTISLISDRIVPPANDVEEKHQENLYLTNNTINDEFQLLRQHVVASVDMQVKLPHNIDEYENYYVKLQEESKPKTKKMKMIKKKLKMEKKLKGKEIMQCLFLAMIEGFVFDPGIHDSDLRTNPSQEEGNDGDTSSPRAINLIMTNGPYFEDMKCFNLWHMWAMFLLIYFKLFSSLF